MPASKSWQPKWISACMEDIGGVSSWLAAKIYLLFLLGSACIYVALALNQSSIGVWEEYFPRQPVEQFVDLGTAKHIRSDEWNTQTPWVLGQVTSGFRSNNMSIGGEGSPLIASVPVYSPIMVGQPKFYGFFLFEKDYGFSWLWAYKTFALLASCFYLLFLVNGKRWQFAVLGSIWVYCSAFTQWWFSSNLPEQLTALFVGLIGAMLLVDAKTTRAIVAAVFFLWFGAFNSLLHAYPPFQIPMIYLGLAVVFGYFADGAVGNSGRHAITRQHLISLAIFIVLAVSSSLYYLIEARPAIDAMRATVYPGDRVSLPGTVSILKAFAGSFQVAASEETQYPVGFGNASEASAYMSYPCLLFLVAGKSLLAKGNRVVAAILLVWMLFLVWICVPVPLGLSVLGFKYSPPERAIVGLGLASIFLVIIFAQRVRDGRISGVGTLKKWITFAVGLIFFTCLAIKARELDPRFFTYPRILMGLTLFGCIHFAAFTGKPVWLIPVVLVVGLNLSVNPLLSGLSSVIDKPVLVAARAQTYEQNNRWAVVGSFVLSQGLKAQGLDVVTGSQITPTPEYSRVFDPTGRYEEVWNRYAHIVLESKPGLMRPQFTLVQPDMYVIRLDVCGPELDALGVTRMAYAESVPEKDKRCLSPLNSPRGTGVQLYERTSRQQ